MLEVFYIIGFLACCIANLCIYLLAGIGYRLDRSKLEIILISIFAIGLTYALFTNSPLKLAA